MWEPVDTSPGTNAGQLWDQQDDAYQLYGGTLHILRSDAAGGAGKLVKRCGSELASIVYGRFKNQCALDCDHFSIEINSTRVKWGIAQQWQFCEIK